MSNRENQHVQEDSTSTNEQVESKNNILTSEKDRQVIPVHIRWMIRRDMPEVLDIENTSFEVPWSEEDFIRCLRQRNCVGKISEHGEKVVGFMIYELHKTMLRILNFAVHPGARQRSVGTQMLSKLIGKLSPQRRSKLTTEVRETNLPAQIFFRRNDFKATGILKDFYDDTTEDAYAMEYRYQGFEQEEAKKSNRNRRMGA